MIQRAHGRSMGGAEGMGEDVIVQVVHVHGSRATIEVGRYGQGEELADPDGKDDLQPQPAEALRTGGAGTPRRAHHETGQLEGGEPKGLDHHPAQQSCGQEQAEERKTCPRGLQEPGEGQETVRRAPREDTAIARAAREDAALG